MIKFDETSEFFSVPMTKDEPMAGQYMINLNDYRAIKFWTLNEQLEQDTSNIFIVFHDNYGKIPFDRFRAAIEGLTRDSLSFTYKSNKGRHLTVNSLGTIKYFGNGAIVGFSLTRSAADDLKGIAYLSIAPAGGYSFMKNMHETGDSFKF
jgi:hypothetical protein